MTDPSAATPAGGSVIHDLGYRPYTGPRLGAGAIARALTLTGFRNAFGLGRSGKSKVLPFVLLALNLLPAVIVGGVLAFAGLDELPIGYAEYASTTQVLVGIFVAAQAPVLFSRDLRHGTISLYLARPLRSSAYALSRWTSLLGATLVFLLLPILILYVVALLGELDVSEQTRQAGIAVGLAVLLALSLAGLAGLVASWSTRRGFAVVATIALLVIANGIVTAVQGISSEEGRSEVGEVAGLFSPYSLYRGLMGAWTGADVPTPPTSTGMELAYVGGVRGPLRGLPRRAACGATGGWRPHERAQPGPDVALVRQRRRGQRHLDDRAPRRHRPARPERCRQDHDHRADVRLPRPVGGHRHPRRRAGLAAGRRVPHHRAGARARAELRLPHRAPVRAGQRRAARPRRPRCRHRAGPRRRRDGRARRRAGSAPTPRACASGSSSPRRWCTTRRCSCSTSRSTASTPASGCT